MPQDEEKAVGIPASPVQDAGLSGLSFGDSATENLVLLIKQFFSPKHVDSKTDLNIRQIRNFMIIRQFSKFIHGSAYATDSEGETIIDPSHPSPFVQYDNLLNPYYKMMAISDKRLGRKEGSGMMSSVMGYNPREGQETQENASSFFNPGKLRQ